MYNNYIPQGVFIKTRVLSNTDKATVVYDGILNKSGANEIYAHIGYGDNHNWKDTSYFKMNKTTNGFETSVPIDPVLKLNIAFKDSANNWDNNTGSNYSFDLT